MEREFINLGLINHGSKGNMWKTKGTLRKIKGTDEYEKVWHFISAHLNPLWEEAAESPNLIMTSMYLLMCSCKSFTIGIPKNRDNPFMHPCIHIKDFYENEVSIALLEGEGK